jgi:hypothetical protein
VDDNVWETVEANGRLDDHDHNRQQNSSMLKGVNGFECCSFAFIDFVIEKRELLPITRLNDASGTWC